MAVQQYDPLKDQSQATKDAYSAQRTADATEKARVADVTARQKQYESAIPARRNVTDSSGNTTSVNMPTFAQAEAEGNARKLRDQYGGWLKSEQQNQSTAPQQQTAAPASTVTDEDRQASASRIDAARGDGNMPTYQPGYQPPQRSAATAAAPTAAAPAASAIPSSGNGIGGGSADYAGQLRRMQDLNRQDPYEKIAGMLANQKADTSGSWANYMGSRQAIQNNAAAASAMLGGLKDQRERDINQDTLGAALERTRMSEEGATGRTRISQEGEDRRVGMRADAERENLDYKESLGSTQADIEHRKALKAQAEASAGSVSQDSERKRKANDLQDQILKLQDEGGDPKAIAKLQRQHAAMTGGKTDSALDTANTLSEMYAREVDPMMRAKVPYDTWRQQRGFADGGMVEGYAEGGAIPAGYGDVPSMPNVTPFVNDYRRYSMMSQRMGVTPVDMEQFAYLRGSAKRAQALQPGMGAPEQGSQMGMQAFADGGMVDAMAAELETGAAGMNNPLLQRQQAMQGYADGGRVDPVTNAVGSAAMAGMRAIQPVASPVYNAVQDFGGAIGRGIYNMTHSDPNMNPQPQQGGVRQTVLNRTRQIDEAAGFAQGGAIPVAGRKIEGPGTGTSDSIPAIIDGQRPAALSTGEFVIPAEVVKAKGTEFFEKLLAQYKGKDQSSGA